MSNTLVLGASDNPDRFSYRAITKLLQHGHSVIPISLRPISIHNLSSLPDIEQVTDPVDTVTIYLNPNRLTSELDKIIELQPRRAIFNPGTESATAIKQLQDSGIEVIQDCTLVMLNNQTY